MDEITVLDLKDNIDDGLGGSIIIDVRSETDHEQGHILGAINIPIDEIALRIGEISHFDKVYIHCGGGTRSKRACIVLEEHGIEAVNIVGGYRAWKSI